MNLSRNLLCLASACLVVLAACTTAREQPGPVPLPEVRDEAQRVDQAGNQQPAALAPVTDARAAMVAAESIQRSAATMRKHEPLMAYMPTAPYLPQPQDRENYAKIEANAIQRVAESPVSTFSIDVDTGSYSNVRRFLRQGRLPPQDAVRVEEMINYFDYAYAPPRDTATPFSVLTELAPAPWNAKAQLLRIGIQGWKPAVGKGARQPSNLVFLVDVSGSMQDPAKLPLVKSSLKLLAQQLDARDRISLVVYAGSTGVVLEPTPGNETAKIVAALDRLEAGGSTNGGAGIDLAYAMAQQAYLKEGNNRVLLATDGDFNVGTTSFERLVDKVEEKRKSGIALTTLGFGEGNYNDHLMEQLADAGNGNHAYIDTLAEAQKVLVDQRDATLRTIAADVKIQVEFNPAAVSEYRLIGYENRLLKREDFNNDKVDAGEIGAGHRVTALYEVVLAGSGGDSVDPLRYQAGATARAVSGKAQELAFVRLRYKDPNQGMDAASRLIEQPVHLETARKSLADASASFRLAVGVAGFGQLLRGGTHTGTFQYTDVERLVRAARDEDAHGYAGELLQLVKLAQGLSAQQLSVRETKD